MAHVIFVHINRQMARLRNGEFSLWVSIELNPFLCIEKEKTIDLTERHEFIDDLPMFACEVIHRIDEDAEATRPILWRSDILSYLIEAFEITVVIYLVLYCVRYCLNFLWRE